MARIPFDPRSFGGPRRPGMRPRPSPPQGDPTGQFRSLNATLLFCPNCREATPARERLLLVLPSGNKYEYRCSYCGTTTGEKIDQNQQAPTLIIP
ncbi:MAG: cytoplasmic protein [Nitrospira sp. SB0675_bin_23]|nr:cytoplasmic protein [Nitrospira sp. SB0667_bin_9]MYD30145.1 cytoplasmic protein [Nitrospira sp. SB0661_bin_20]MYH01077.1 cytoplasmic protein [Nitrospira sp. SB0675_bin_23]MYJ23441.1 cytoplasmic protein [Nitrospira sp. SB0673_bin_12]